MLTVTPAAPLPTLLAATGVTRKALAEAVGVTPGYISALCAGRYRPSQRLARDIAEALGVTVDYLWPKEAPTR